MRRRILTVAWVVVAFVVALGHSPWVAAEQQVRPGTAIGVVVQNLRQKGALNADRRAFDKMLDARWPAISAGILKSMKRSYRSNPDEIKHWLKSLIVELQIEGDME